MIFASLFRRRHHADAAHALYEAAVGRARTPAFYRDFAVPDTVEGRFEMISLHVFLILRRLRAETATAEAAPLAQALFDLMFADMDRNLRELGVGDLAVGRRVKAMARALYGRIAAYERGLAEGAAALAGALQRNLFGDAAAVPTAAALVLARYMADSVAALDAVPASALVRGETAFAAVPVPEGAG